MTAKPIDVVRLGRTTARPDPTASVSSETERVRALLVRHQRTVDRLVYRLLGPDSDHEDIVQDVFVRIAAKASTQRDAQRERAWVGVITVNVVRNHLRRRRVRRVVELRATPPETEQLLEPRLVARDMARRGYALMDRLDPADRIALVLRRLEERPLDEVAALCRCSRATAKRRIRRAESHLAALLEDRPELYATLTGRRTK